MLFVLIGQVIRICIHAMFKYTLATKLYITRKANATIDLEQHEECHDFFVYILKKLFL